MYFLNFALAGRLVGAVCAMTGILVIAMPIPIIVNNFTRQYQRLKPVSKFWEESQLRKQSGTKDENSDVCIGLYNAVDLNRNEATTNNDVNNDETVHIETNGNIPQNSTT